MTWLVWSVPIPKCSIGTGNCENRQIDTDRRQQTTIIRNIDAQNNLEIKVQFQPEIWCHHLFCRPFFPRSISTGKGNVAIAQYSLRSSCKSSRRHSCRPTTRMWARGRNWQFNAISGKNELRWSLDIVAEKTSWNYYSGWEIMWEVSIWNLQSRSLFELYFNKFVTISLKFRTLLK